MGTYEKQQWISTGLGQSRRQRASGSYLSYVPTKLTALDLSLDADVVGDVANAQARIELLNSTARFVTNSEGVARLLLRAEAVSSSHIEGLTVGPRRLLRAEAAMSGLGSVKFDETAVAIIGNIHALEDALNAVLEEKEISTTTILGIHKKLCEGTPIERFGGVVRDRQNWVGGSSYNPLSADYVPPAPQHLDELLADLASFCNDETISPIEQAAIAHAQFETIHPFIDGNGRTGRALIHLILRRRGVALRFVPPISLALATHSTDYIAGLVGFRSDDAAERSSAREGINDWVSTFSGCCIQACEEAERFERAAEEIKTQWLNATSKNRREGILEDVAACIIGMPIFTVKSLVMATGRSTTAVSQAVDALQDAGCIRLTGSGRRNRVFEAPAVIDEFNKLERRLASPVGDTSYAPPARPVPENLAKARKRNPQ